MNADYDSARREVEPLKAVRPAGKGTRAAASFPFALIRVDLRFNRRIEELRKRSHLHS